MEGAFKPSESRSVPDGDRLLPHKSPLKRGDEVTLLVFFEVSRKVLIDQGFPYLTNAKIGSQMLRKRASQILEFACVMERNREH